ncbi:uncharacterized protein LOC131330619 isoform X1 [Rhododendron vialii]|uniref:uncharacterized protein LOC131330619 isoform X1 n=1 Tax=Rhododendron vialii TaxID=182163 RepID=UPI00265F9FE2|nr:uncharacterized protein LOC131330619 isoform X1 [Rhododendron vialii]
MAPRRAPLEEDPPSASSSSSTSTSTSEDDQPTDNEQEENHNQELPKETAESESSEDEDEEEEEVKNNKPYVQKPTPTTTATKTPQPNSPSDSDSETRSAQPSPTASDFTIKPIASKPMENPKKPTSNPSAKRPVTETDEKNPKKKAKVEEEEEEVEEKKKSGGSVNRLWSEDDETVLLKGMAGFQSKKGADPYLLTGEFDEFIKKSLSVEVSRSQLMDKVRRLKKKKEINAGQGEKGADPVFSKPHEHKCFELSKKVWGGGKDSSNGVDENGKSWNERARKTVKLEDSVALQPKENGKGVGGLKEGFKGEMKGVKVDEIFVQSDLHPGRPEKPKRRTREEMAADLKTNWEAKMAARGFKSERRVHAMSLGKDSASIQQITKRGLNFWTRSLDGYNAKGVIEFYQKMNIENVLATGKITSKVANKVIEVDACTIAKYLKYIRPAPEVTNYPQPEPIDPDDINQALYTNPNDASLPHKPGKFRDVYRVLNQALHYNLYPRGTESKPSKKSAELLYVFMHDNYVMDWAKCIFEQLVDFKGNTIGSARMPFPCMITGILKDQGVRGSQYAKLDQPSPGDITLSVLEKSKSQSKASGAGPSVPAPPKGSLYTMPRPRAPLESWLRKIFCQNVAILKMQKRDWKERKKMMKEIGKLQGELSWHTCYIASTTDERYEAPPEVEVANSSEEGEGNEEEENE